MESSSRRALRRGVVWTLATLALLGCGSDEAAPPAEDVVVVEPEPGRVTWRRLSRYEYDNTMRDLLGTALRPGRDMPADDMGYGFDNVAEVLTLSPLHLELYELAAAALTAEALTPPITEPLTLRTEGAAMTPSEGAGQAFGDDFLLWSNGTLRAPLDVPIDGTYTVQVHAWGDQAGPDLPQMVILLDAAIVATVDVAATAAAPQTYETAPVHLSAGRHHVTIEFTNDYFEEPADRNLWVGWVALHGPAETKPWDAWPWSRVMLCDEAKLVAESRACAEQVVRRLATRAFRRPVEEGEATRLLALFDAARADGLPFLPALAVPVQAILMAPQLVFRAEHAGAPGASGPEPLSGWEIATRLSYMLWSSMPDEALRAAAASGALATTDGIATQVRRMLRDPRAEALVESFASQWLYIRDVDNVFPDQTSFPAFDEALRAAMREEMTRFFRTFVTEDRSVMLLTASETFVNQRLAEHYGLDVTLPGSEAWARVSTAGTDRRGLLTQAGLLTALSTPFRTSIVRRGKWVLGQLLCDAPKPPPAGVEALIEETTGEGPKTLRQLMEQHVGDPFCQACHKTMDPLGFALENYDGLGAWRDLDKGLPIDATGRLPDGTTFHGALEMVDVVAADARFPRCVAEKAFVYALGRGLREDYDAAYLDEAVAAFEAGGYRFEALLVAIAVSDPFRYRRAEQEER